MSQQTARVFITNGADGTAKISLWHYNKDYGNESAVWTAGPHERVGPLTVHFNTGAEAWFIYDYWACEISVTGGLTPGLYESSGILEYSDWKENQLWGADADQDLEFSVNSGIFNVALKSRLETTPMNAVKRESAQVYILNKASGHATITLFHNNSTDGTQNATWPAAPGERVGPLTVWFRVGMKAAFILDYWAVKLVVEDGPQAGTYANAGGPIFPTWKECQLQRADVGGTLTFGVDTQNFDINVPSGFERAAMRQAGPARKIDNVFVLMLENHSFDNIFAFSGIKDLRVATQADANSHNGKSYAVGPPGAPSSMPTDPGHEFNDVVEQLCGETAFHTPWQPYNQPITNSGFVSNYATTDTEITKNNPRKPADDEWGQVMQCFDTPKQLPVIYQLATTFAVCDAWHSSIPGPTWPNRFFVHGASSAGLADSPENLWIVVWEAPGGGIFYPSGASIYDKLVGAGQQWRVYADPNGPDFGGVPQVASIKGIQYLINTNEFAVMAADLQGPYPYAYTFIEPNYGDVMGGSYVGGSSQHPMDGVARGEALIKATYEAIRNSPVWDRSLLIVTYDEHGGFYDSAKPGPAKPPADGSPNNPVINKSGFLFDWLGVRVPAVVISPLIPAGSVDHTPYDHASVPATLEALFGMSPMTERDKHANNVLHLLSLPKPRTDCPTVLNNPAVEVRPHALMAGAQAAALAAAPLPTVGSAQGFLSILAKTDVELARGDPVESALIVARVAAIKTVGEAQAYARDVTARAKQARAARDAAAAPPPARALR